MCVYICEETEREVKGERVVTEWERECQREAEKDRDTEKETER